MRIRRGVVTVACAVVVLGACSDDTSVDVVGDGDGQATTDAPDGDGATDDGVGDDGPAAATGGSQADVLNELIARAADATYQVTYVAPSPDGPVEFTLAHEGDATAILFDGGRLIQTGSEVVTCAEGECFVVPQGMFQIDQMLGGMMGTVGISLALNDGTVFASGVDVEVAADTIAGRSATCATLNPSDFADMVADQDLPDGTYTACIDDETGVMLRVTSPVGDEGFEAIAFSTTVDAGIFTPPSTPQQPGG